MSLAAVTTAAIAAVQPSYAAEKIWASTGSNSWTTAGNWTGGVPGSSDLAVFNDSSSVFTGIPSGTASSTGGILLSGSRTATQLIQPYNSSTNTSLTINGYSYTINGETFNLLIGNTSAATLSITERSSTLSMPVTIGSSGVIYAGSGATIALGSDTGDGGNGYSITKKGAGLLQLGDGYGGANTYSGGFMLEEGTVTTYASSTVTSGSLVSSAFGTGTVTLRGGELRSTSSNSRTYANAVVLDGGAAIGGETTGTGNITISATAGKATTLLSDSTLTVRNRTEWAQAISGSASLTKSGSGVLVLSSSTNSYTGATYVNKGTLILTGAMTSNVTVASGATFGGTGTASGTISIASGATLSPGTYDGLGNNTRGILTTDSDVSLAAGSTLSIRADSASSYDQIYMLGAFDLGGANLELALNYQPAADDLLVLIWNDGYESIDGLLSYDGTTLEDGDTFLVSTGTYSQWFAIDYSYTSGGYSDSLALVAVNAVPEPNTMLFLASAGLLLNARRRGDRRC